MWEPDTLRAGSAGPGRSEDGMSGKKKSGSARAVPRAYGRLTRHERDTVQRMLERRASCREIARELGRSPSTVSAEVASHRFVTAPKARRGERVDASADLSAACPRLAAWPRCCNGCGRYRAIGCKTRDAQFLAVQLALGVVTEVHVPDAECEGARDLARALADARDDAVRAKQRLSKFLLRRGLVYDERNAAGQRRNRWTGDFWAWVGRIDLGDAAAMATLDHYCERVREADAAKAALEAKVKSLAQQPRWKPTCDALKCLKGIDAVTAASIACEADGFARFATASGFAAWVGLVPSEHSSGESRFRGGITKAGNKHLRKLLVEAAWHYKGASRSPKDLAKGQVVDAATRRHANAGVRRLVDRRRSMDDAGKQSSVANVAVARELACWCWAVGRMAEGA